MDNKNIGDILTGIYESYERGYSTLELPDDIRIIESKKRAEPVEIDGVTYAFQHDTYACMITDIPTDRVSEIAELLGKDLANMVMDSIRTYKETGKEPVYCLRRKPEISIQRVLNFAIDRETGNVTYEDTWILKSTMRFKAGFDYIYDCYQTFHKLKPEWEKIESYSYSYFEYSSASKFLFPLCAPRASAVK